MQVENKGMETYLLTVRTQIGVDNLPINVENIAEKILLQLGINTKWKSLRRYER
jgi:hypothetical protein